MTPIWPSHVAVALALSTVQDEPRPQGQCLSGLPATSPGLELLTLFCADHQSRFRSSRSHRHPPCTRERSRERYDPTVSETGHWCQRRPRWPSEVQFPGQIAWERQHGAAEEQEQRMIAGAVSGAGATSSARRNERQQEGKARVHTAARAAKELPFRRLERQSVGAAMADPTGALLPATGHCACASRVTLMAQPVWPSLLRHRPPSSGRWRRS